MTAGALAVAVCAAAACGSAAAGRHAAVPTVRCTADPSVPEAGSLPPAPQASGLGDTASLLAWYAAPGIGAFGPRSWSCRAGTNPEGGLSLLASPPHSPSFRLTPAATPAPQQAVSVTIAANGTTQPLYLACAHFPLAARRLVAAGLSCPRIATADRERGARIDAATYGFTDPAHVAGTGYPSGGPYPARGIMLWRPDAAAGGTGAVLVATCTVEPELADVCAPLLEQIRVTWLQTQQ